MKIRKLETWQERLEGNRVIATAFLHPWDQGEEQEKAQRQGPLPHGEELWGCFDDDGTMLTCISTLRRTLAFGGAALPASEVHMVGSLPERRGGGAVRAMMASLLQDFRGRGDALAVLIPFSCPFYRKFGFEQVARSVRQRFAIDQLASFPCGYRVSELREEDDLARIRSLYDRFALSRNLAELRGDDDWAWRCNGEFGEPPFMHEDQHRYTYILWNEHDEPCAYLRFLFTHEPNMPFVGEAHVTELVYDSPQALIGCLGFLYRLRAKISHVVVEPLDDIDFSTLLPESDNVEQTVDGHIMARVLDMKRLLTLMPQPDGEGSYVLGVRDAFLPEVDGSYQVSFADGRATSVARTNLAPDLEADETTICQLVLGRTCLDDALLRPGTTLNAHEVTLRRAFIRRTVCLR